MKILIINTSEMTGGAAIAASRLSRALLRYKITVNMLVLHKQTNDPFVVTLNNTFLRRTINKFRFLFERGIIFLNNSFSKENLFKVSIANTGTDISNHPLVKEADILHLHWINQGFLSLFTIKKLIQTGKPVLWTMHDMWPCTGICHHAWECKGYMYTCGECPFLHSKKAKDLSYRTFKKKGFLSRSSVHMVAVSSWLKRKVEESSLTKGLAISVIPNVIDTLVFCPSDKREARERLSLPHDKDIILMGAARLNDPIKGFEYLKEALSSLVKLSKRDNLLLILFGFIKKEPSFLSGLPIDYIYRGSLSDMQEIAKLYSAADVTVVPSYYETFGQTLIEAMACGCPVVSFDNSGQTDIIDHKTNGYLAKYKDSEDLARGIEWVLDNKNQTMSTICIEKVKTTYSEEVVAKQYISLYNELLSQ